jgi:hypothetical protein
VRSSFPPNLSCELPHATPLSRLPVMLRGPIEKIKLIGRYGFESEARADVKIGCTSLAWLDFVVRYLDLVLSAEGLGSTSHCHWRYDGRGERAPEVIRAKNARWRGLPVASALPGPAPHSPLR